jgi:hypothetical protein
MMKSLSPPVALQFLLVMFAGWVNRRQQDVIAYLQEENSVLREQLGGCRLRFTDDQRRRLAAKGKALGRKGPRKNNFVELAHRFASASVATD